VRFRVDGILNAADPFSRNMGDAVINIFKVLADLDITEKRKPQDGGLSARVSGKNIDFRVATSGSVVGEKMVMRILDKSQQIISLTQLGLRDRLRDSVHTIAQQPHGMLIVCGPTGAGKSTTLYACLNEIDRYQKNVITVENPVEYHIENVTQIEINPKAGKTFAGELRSILRQDPDGHLHRRNSRSGDSGNCLPGGHDRSHGLHHLARQRYRDGARAFDRSRRAALHGLRRRQRHSGSAAGPPPLPQVQGGATSPTRSCCARRICLQRRSSFSTVLPDSANGDGKVDLDAQPEACTHCGGTGYFGRTGIFELLVITDRLRDMIRDNPNLNAIRQEAVKNGMKYLQEDGLRQVIEGKTSIQELLARVEIMSWLAIPSATESRLES